MSQTTNADLELTYERGRGTWCDSVSRWSRIPVQDKHDSYLGAWNLGCDGMNSPLDPKFNRPRNQTEESKDPHPGSMYLARLMPLPPANDSAWIHGEIWDLYLSVSRPDCLGPGLAMPIWASWPLNAVLVTTDVGLGTKQYLT
ncbi:hypothetical protein B0H13DRAFT_1894353 [Mycena leptocephala]|nr:hypothetical protein B0H13DRAFT_1894353 [Mycena leptocephala]